MGSARLRRFANPRPSLPSYEYVPCQTPSAGNPNGHPRAFDSPRVAVPCPPYCSLTVLSEYGATVTLKDEPRTGLLPTATPELSLP
jgi:hypothetical protein